MEARGERGSLLENRWLMIEWSDCTGVKHHDGDTGGFLVEADDDILIIRFSLIQTAQQQHQKKYNAGRNAYLTSGPALSEIPTKQVTFVIPGVCRRRWLKMASYLIRHNYAPLCIFNLQTSGAPHCALQTRDTAPSVGWKNIFFLLKCGSTWEVEGFQF